MININIKKVFQIVEIIGIISLILSIFLFFKADNSEKIVFANLSTLCAIGLFSFHVISRYFLDIQKFL